MPIPEPYINLLVLGFQPGEKLYDGLEAREGIHFRWFIPPELGFPENGFRLYFLSNEGTVENEINSSNAPIKLPETLEEGLARLDMFNQSERLKERYRDAMQALQPIIDLAKSYSSPVPPRLRLIHTSQNEVNVAAIDYLMAAALDPYVAAMLGLYYIFSDTSNQTSSLDQQLLSDPSYAGDQTSKPQLYLGPNHPLNSDINKNPFLFRIKGDWGEQNWPYEEVRLSQSSLQGLKADKLNIADLQVYPHHGRCLLGIEESKGQRHLTCGIFIYQNSFLAILARCSFVLVLPYEVQQVELILTKPFEADQLEVKVDGAFNLTPDVEGNILRLGGLEGNGYALFRRLQISYKGLPIHITHIRYWEKVGLIGNELYSSREYYKDSSHFPIPPLHIHRYFQQPITPYVNSNNGLVHADVNQLFLYGDVFSPPDPISRPVRLHVSRAKLSDGEMVEEVITNPSTGLGDPLLIKSSNATPILPNLLGYWPLSENFKNAKTGEEAIGRGDLRFFTDKEIRGKRKALYFPSIGKSYISFGNHPELENWGRTFSIFFWVKPLKGRGDLTQTLLTNWMDDPEKPDKWKKRKGFWLGLESNYKLKLRIEGKTRQMDQRLEAGIWTRVGVVYDGRALYFYKNAGLEDATEDQDGPLGSIDFWHVNGLSFGARKAYNGRYTDSYAGWLSELEIWQSNIDGQEAMHLRKGLTSGFETKNWGNLLFRLGDTLHSGPTASGFFKDLVFPIPQGVKSLGNQMTIYLWVSPSFDRSEGYRALVSHHLVSFSVGLADANDRGETVPVFKIGAASYKSEKTIVNSQVWSHLGFIYDGYHIHFYLNRVKTESIRVSTATISWVDIDEIKIGRAKDGQNKEVDVFNGYLGQIEIWQEVLTPGNWRKRTAPIQYATSEHAEGFFGFRLQPIDLFGRVGEWSNTQYIHSKNDFPPEMPINVQAAFLPLTGKITNVSSDRKRLNTTVPLPPVLKADTADKYLNRYEIEIIHSIEQNEQRQSFELNSISLAEQGLDMDIRWPSFPGFLPDIGDRITLLYDSKIEVRWGWTGLQRLLHPHGVDFRVSWRAGDPNQLTARIERVDKLKYNSWKVELKVERTFPVETFDRYPVQIHPHQYLLSGPTDAAGRHFQLQYGGYPFIAPRPGQYVDISLRKDNRFYEDIKQSLGWEVFNDEILSIDHDWYFPVVSADNRVRAQLLPGWDPNYQKAPTKRAQLATKGVDWLPYSDLYQVTFKQTDLSGLPDSLVSAIREPVAEEYITGALVVWDSARIPPQYTAYLVLWHEWENNGNLTLYFAPDTSDQDWIPLLSEARFYPGRSYRRVLDLSTPPPLSTARPKVSYFVSLTVTDQDGIRSERSRLAQVIAVDRRRPPVPEAPVARMMPADFYKESRSVVSWNRPLNMSALEAEMLSYMVYRASDVAIFERDLEQRKQQTGLFGLDDVDRFFDDPDFGEWWRAYRVRHPETPANTMRSVPPANTESDQWRTYQAAWRDWADRFYPALPPVKVRELAERPGNETAFTQLHEQPKEPNELAATHRLAEKEYAYLDQAPGLVSNTFLYRIRSMAPNLAESTGWSAASYPVTSPSQKPPRKPVFTRIEAGDRSVTLHWALNREPDLKEYRLYRSERKEDLEDLRWWSNEPDPRLIAVIPDPRLKVEWKYNGNEVDYVLPLPEGLEIEEVIGVYRLEEYDFEKGLGEQRGAINYWRKESEENIKTSQLVINETEDFAELMGLRAVRSGMGVALAYRLKGQSFAIFRINPNQGLLKVKNRELILPKLDIKKLLAVYRLEDFDFAAPDPTNQPKNYLKFGVRFLNNKVPYKIVSFQEVDEGLAMVFVYENSSAQIKTTYRRPPETSYLDADSATVIGQYYRLIAINQARILSLPSNITEAKAKEQLRPKVPEFELDRVTEEGAFDQVSIYTQEKPDDLEWLVQRSGNNTSLWKTVQQWTALLPDTPLIDTIPSGIEFDYKIHVRTKGQKLQAEHIYLNADPNE